MELCCFAATPTAAIRPPKPSSPLRFPVSHLLPRRLPALRSNTDLRFPGGRLIRAAKFEEASFASVKRGVEEVADGGEESVVAKGRAKGYVESVEEVREDAEVVEYEEEAAAATVTETLEGKADEVLGFLKDLDLTLEPEDAYPIFLYGTGAFVALWVSSAIVSALDSLPLIPMALEIVGLGYTVWFSYRYLVFKKNRDELSRKVEDLKEQILGTSD